MRSALLTSLLAGVLLFLQLACAPVPHAPLQHHAGAGLPLLQHAAGDAPFPLPQQPAAGAAALLQQRCVHHAVALQVLYLRGLTPSPAWVEGNRLVGMTSCQKTMTFVQYLLGISRH